MKSPRRLLRQRQVTRNNQAPKKNEDRHQPSHRQTMPVVRQADLNKALLIANRSKVIRSFVDSLHIGGDDRTFIREQASTPGHVSRCLAFVHCTKTVHWCVTSVLLNPLFSI